ncbi:MAG: hypothetical protein ACYC4K_01780 [Thiobacillus sp.]
MSNESANNPLLGKMDALIKKHRGPAEAPPESTPPPGWLPVLTEVLVRGSPPLSSPVPTPTVTSTATAEPVVAVTPAQAGNDTEQLANQLLDELGPKLSAVMEQQVATELRKNLDETVALLLSQLDVSVRDIVRDAVAEKLKTSKPDS